MTGFSIRLDLDDSAPRKALGLLASEDFTPLMGQIGLALEASARRRIEETNTAPDGERWPQSGAARKRGSPTLFETGRLAASIHHVSGPASVEVGTNVVYAAIHQFGGEIKREAREQALHFAYDHKTGSFKGFAKKRKARVAMRVKIGAHSIHVPARPYIGVSEDDKETIRDLARRFVQGSAP